MEANVDPLPTSCKILARRPVTSFAEILTEARLKN